MTDRIPTHAGRVRLTPVSGDLYDLEMADEPTVAGTPLNKATLLTDATAIALGLTNSAVPDDAFQKLVPILSAFTGASANLLRYEIGEYTGTGAVTNTINFTAVNPILVFVWTAGSGEYYGLLPAGLAWEANYGAVLTRYASYYSAGVSGTAQTGVKPVPLTWTDSSVSIDASSYGSAAISPRAALSDAGEAYHWLAIGTEAVSA